MGWRMLKGGFKSRVVFAKCDWVARGQQRLSAEDRTSAIMRLQFGSGLNIKHWPPGVRHTAT